MRRSLFQRWQHDLHISKTHGGITFVICETPYDHDEALTILLHVKDFMEVLSSRLTQVPELTT
jgi:hypothetical protein